jgi:segregation and condensation protein A
LRELDTTADQHPSVGEGPWTIDLDVFEGPFDLLITLILNEEIDLLEVNLAEVVLAYIERLEARGELDLEAATEFPLLIAALLELYKSGELVWRQDETFGSIEIMAPEGRS